MLADALRKVGNVKSAELFLPRSGKRLPASFAEGDYRVIGSVVSENIRNAAMSGCLIFRYYDAEWVQDEELAKMGITGYRAGEQVSRIYLVENVGSSDFLEVGLGMGLFAAFDPNVIEQAASFFDSIRAKLKLFSPFCLFAISSG